MGNPIDKYRQNAVLEGGKSGSGGSSALETATKVGGPAALTFVGGIGGSQMIKNAREKREQEKKMKLVYRKMLEDMYMDMINN
jgi:hypothetical protein